MSKDDDRMYPEGPSYAELAGENETAQPKEGGWPVAAFYKVLEGYDIHKSGRIWEAVLVVQDDKGKKHLRLYKWVNKEKGWKVDLARFDIGYWNLKETLEKIQGMKARHRL